jgi:hypothetical protein
MDTMRELLPGIYLYKIAIIQHWYNFVSEHFGLEIETKDCLNIE